MVTDFTTAKSIPDGWKLSGTGSASYTGAGAGLILGKKGDNPTLETTGYMFFGSLEVTLKAAPGQGVVTSIVMLSDSLDEIDWELVGGNAGQVQSNYFGKGDTSSYDRAAWHNIASPQTIFHTYKVDWTPSAMTLSVDGAVVRALNYKDAQGGTRYPQSPMKVRLGIWAGGDPSNGQGTVDWAGGLTDFSKVPYTMYVQNVKIVNYSPAKSYSFGDNSGDYPSIKIDGGALMVNNGGTASLTTAASLSTGLSKATAVPTANPIGAGARNATANSTITSASRTPTASASPIATGNAGSHVEMATTGGLGALFALAMLIFA